ncbi:DUF3619 family protein [Zoogloea sp.]|uniref:DUF3619 family protein n=1 Tax=Zoogloea sp. TaxID=49181 RepID=UPI0014169C02|nr:MAG: DUF3619 family protein [Zoogloea sp.]
MNERELQIRIRQHLNMSARDISLPVANRLAEARQKALSRQKVRARRLSLAGLGQSVADHILPDGRTAVAMLAVLLLALASGFLGELQHVADLEEVDSALLADDLPIDAYLDRGFDAWVQNESPD